MLWRVDELIPYVSGFILLNHFVLLIRVIPPNNRAGDEEDI